jgi:glutaredoxin
MKIPFNLRFLIIILVIIIVAAVGIYLVVSQNIANNKDNEPPVINSITGNTTGKPGKITTITVNFSDNVKVTSATLFYRSENSETWQNMPIINGTADLLIPLGSTENWYYYVVIDDNEGNGPVGDPSTDGKVYYTIDVTEIERNLVHTVFIEDGTGTWCSNCPAVSEILHDLYASGDYNFYYISLVEDKNQKAADRLKNDYNIYEYPTVFIDGGYELIYGANHTTSYFTEQITRAEQRNVPDIELNLSTVVNEDKTGLDITVSFTNYQDESYSGRLRVYLTQKLALQDYEGNPYHFAFYDYILNEQMTVSPKDSMEKTGSYDVSSLDIDNLMVIAVIFSDESTTKYANPSGSSNPFEAHYADAAAASEVVVGGNLPPQVGITNPKNGRLHILGKEIIATRQLKTIILGRITVTAQASDDSAVAKVEFYLDDNLVKECTSEPYEWKWKTPSWFRYKHTLTVVAYDDTGKTSSTSLDVIAFILL